MLVRDSTATICEALRLFAALNLCHIAIAELCHRYRVFFCFSCAVFVPVTLSKVCGDFSIGSLVISENDSYYFFLALFAALVLPFCFMNFSNTKPLQLCVHARVFCFS